MKYILHDENDKESFIIITYHSVLTLSLCHYNYHCVIVSPCHCVTVSLCPLQDVMRQFQQVKKRLEMYEHRHGDHDSIGSNASSNGSLDTVSNQQPHAPNSRASSQEPTPPPPPQVNPTNTGECQCRRMLCFVVWFSLLITGLTNRIYGCLCS